MNARSRKTSPLIRAEDLGIWFRGNGRRRISPFSGLRRNGTSRRDQRDADIFWALREVNFTIGAGEAVGLIGANGHGKSTLLRMIAGVLIPDEGKIRVRAPVSPMIEVTGGFLGDLTVRQNIWLAAGLKGLHRRQIAERFDDIVEWAQIGHRLDTPFRHLSSGMKAKVGFAVTTTVDRPILLIDEVLSVGDRAFRQRSFDRLDHMLGQDKTVVLVSHNLGAIERFCRRGLYLREGRLVADGAIEEVVGRYISDIDAGSVDTQVGPRARRRAEAMRRRAVGGAPATVSEEPPERAPATTPAGPRSG